jgi:hypothetical protein
MEKEGYEFNEESDVVDDLTANNDSYPDTVQFIESAYRNAISTCNHNTIHENIISEIDNWFKYKPIEYVNGQIHVISTKDKFIEDINNVWKLVEDYVDINDLVPNKFGLLYFLENYLGAETEEHGIIRETDAFDNLDSYVSSSDFNKALLDY